MLANISEEQRAIVCSIATNNVMTDSVAGSGKTTTVLHLSRMRPDLNILLLTYNSKLRVETRTRAQDLDIKNVEVHTYHSFGVRYIDPGCKTDSGIIKFVSSGIKLPELVPLYNILVIDETQDMNPLYYRLVTKIIAAMPDIKVCVIGDKDQSIYGYAGADERFITLADKIYKTQYTWLKLKLSTSYRITVPMADFINHCVLAEPRLLAVKPGRMPMYTIYNQFNSKIVVTEIKNLLATGYKPEDIFVLAASVKSGNEHNPIKKLANSLSMDGIKIYVPMNDDVKLDDDLIKGKIVFSSFHQAKGLERKAVLIMGFDQSHFTYYDKDADDTKCPNTLYVAMTRATTHLSMYQSSSQPPMKFVRTHLLARYAIVSGVNSKQSVVKDTPNRVAITKMTEHIPSTLLAECLKLVKVRLVRDAGDVIPLPIKTEQLDPFGDVSFEEVSDINGTALPAYYEYRKRGEVSIFKELQLSSKPLKTTRFTKKSNIKEDNKNNVIVVPFVLTNPKLLELSNQYLAMRNGLNYKVKQITSYDWLSEEVLQTAYQRTSEELDKCVNLEMEKSTECTIMGVNISGRMDVICDDRIIEIKSVSSLKPEHVIQLAIYGYCYAINNPSKPLHLFNIRTNGLVEVIIDQENIKKMLSMLICNKYHRRGALTDDEFLRSLGIETNEKKEVVCEECVRAGFQRI